MAEARTATVVGGGVAGLARLAVITARFGCDLGGGWRQSVRNAMLRLAPPKILVRAGTQVVDWTPP